MAAVLANLFRPLGRHQRIQSVDEDDEDAVRDIDAPDGLGGSNVGPSSSNAAPPSPPPVASRSQAAAVARDRGGESSADAASTSDGVPSVVSAEDDADANASDAETVDVETGASPSSDATAAAAAAANDDNATAADVAPTTTQQERLRAYATQRRLAELEEERELRRRRQSTCTLVVVFILFRLWVEALADGDGGLLFVCIVGTSWTAKWIRTRREEEDEMDRAIETYVREVAAANGRGPSSEGGGTATTASASGVGGDGVVDAADLRLMSFQAQLALAILESQRQIMENGGYGHPDGALGPVNAGVSEEARGRWSRYSYRESGGKRSRSSSPAGRRRGGAGRNGGYGSVSSSDYNDEHGVRLNAMEEGHSPERSDAGAVVVGGGKGELRLVDDDEDSLGKSCEGGLDDRGLPSCSICLGEYEKGEQLVRLPCGHIYHEECVTAWVSNHIRCPLCNYNLEAGIHDGE